MLMVTTDLNVMVQKQFVASGYLIENSFDFPIRAHGQQIIYRAHGIEKYCISQQRLEKDSIISIHELRN